jgi:Contractile injection system tape measure protein
MNHDHHKKAEPSDENKKKAATQLPAGEQIIVSNAGLVLLWPFIEKFFTLAELIIDRRFIDEEKKQRAPFLLQYVITGTEERKQQNMALNKILCGIEVALPLPCEIFLTENEKDLSAELLTSVVGLWPALKNTSQEGLRQAFLQRDGLLTIKPTSARLQVARRGFDVLLDQLPWNIGMIKTQWMDQLLIVDW